MSSNKEFEQIVTSVISTVSNHTPHPVNTFYNYSLILSLKISLYVITVSKEALAISCLTILSHTLRMD